MESLQTLTIFLLPHLTFLDAEQEAVADDPERKAEIRALAERFGLPL